MLLRIPYPCAVVSNSLPTDLSAKVTHGLPAGFASAEPIQVKLLELFVEFGPDFGHILSGLDTLCHTVVQLLSILVEVWLILEGLQLLESTERCRVVDSRGVSKHETRQCELAEVTS